MTWGFSVQDLMTEVSGLITTGANALVTPPTEAVIAPHLLGEKHLATSQRGPLYIWVPRKARGQETIAKRAADELRALAAFKDGVDVYCVGRSFAQASALRQNLAKALHDSMLADLSIDGGRWVGPGQAWNQDGETFVLEMSIPTLVLDAWIDIDSLADPTIPTHTIVEVEGELQKTDDVDTAGEVAFTVITED